MSGGLKFSENLPRLTDAEKLAHVIKILKILNAILGKYIPFEIRAEIERLMEGL